jgi:hypothetical protein
MKTNWLGFLVVLVGCVSVHAGPEFEAVLAPFVQTYCLDCHGAEKQKGDRRFDQLTPEIGDENMLIDYQDILDQLNLSEMPPRKADQPKHAEQRAVIKWLTTRIAAYHEQHQGDAARTVLRRLNAREYRHTIRDLFGLNLTMFDPALYFPRDQSSEHLDNVGEELVTSGHLLERYLEAADQVVEKALFPLHRPKIQEWYFENGFNQQPEIDQVHRKTNKLAFMTLYEVIGADKHEGAYGPIHAFSEGVPFDGFYEITVQAEALNRQHPYDRDLVSVDPAQPLRLGIRAGDAKAGELQHTLPVEPLLAEAALADGKDNYTFKVWLDAGYTPRFTFPNGSMDMRALYPKLLKRHPELFPEKKSGGIVEHRYFVLAHGKMPQIRIHTVRIKGPFYDQWPRESQRAALGADWERAITKDLPLDEMRAHVTRFVSRAYRRPASEESVDRIMAVITARMKAGSSSVSAFGDGLKVALCSPNFLYLEPGGDDATPFALASRLSYFLWSAPPDEALLAAAKDNTLNTAAELKLQVARMLSDPRTDAFIDGFLDSWLTLRDLGSAPPDRDTFRSYYQYRLGEAMRQETRLFMRHVIKANRPIDHFIDSDYTFVNLPLARLYGISVPPDRGFQRVQLSDRRRGGLLGQASVLTVTANGIDTSPVVRGVWLLENILGTPPPPPPPDVEPLDPDIRGTITIRDQLNKHRETPSCYDCHQAIDPLGFALENFNPIGAWRSSYGRNTQIDASGELPTGESFDDIIGLKDVLLARKDRFARALATKLLAYAMGRHVGPGDRPHLDLLLAELETVGYGMHDLISLVVLSEPFLAR